MKLKVRTGGARHVALLSDAAADARMVFKIANELQFFLKYNLMSFSCMSSGCSPYRAAAFGGRGLDDRDRSFMGHEGCFSRPRWGAVHRCAAS